MSSIHKQACEAIGQLQRQGATPARVIFNEQGHRRAMSEREAARLFDFGKRTPPTHYMGLPFGVHPGQLQEVTVEPVLRRAVGVEMSIADLGRDLAGVLELVGERLTAPQMCGIIMSYVRHNTCADPDRTPKLVRSLEEAVRRYGRFE